MNMEHKNTTLIVLIMTSDTSKHSHNINTTVKNTATYIGI